MNEKENTSLMEKVSKAELHEVLHNFQKNKISGPDEWTVEFFLAFYDLIGKDILQVVEETHKEGHMHAPINSTFISMIPKYDSPISLDEFKPISLCNCIYKVVAKARSQGE